MWCEGRGPSNGTLLIHSHGGSHEKGHQHSYRVFFCYGFRSFDSSGAVLRNTSRGRYTVLYTVVLGDESEKVIYSTTALRNASTKLKGSDMVFAVVDGHRYLEKIRTPEVGYGFYTSFSDKRSAKVERISVPTSGAPQF